MYFFRQLKKKVCTCLHGCLSPTLPEKLLMRFYQDSQSLGLCLVFAPSLYVGFWNARLWVPLEVFFLRPWDIFWREFLTMSTAGNSCLSVRGAWVESFLTQMTDVVAFKTSAQVSRLPFMIYCKRKAMQHTSCFFVTKWFIAAFLPSSLYLTIAVQNFTLQCWCTFLYFCLWKFPSTVLHRFCVIYMSL